MVNSSRKFLKLFLILFCGIYISEIKAAEDVKDAQKAMLKSVFSVLGASLFAEMAEIQPNQLEQLAAYFKIESKSDQYNALKTLYEIRNDTIAPEIYSKHITDVIYENAFKGANGNFQNLKSPNRYDLANALPEAVARGQREVEQAKRNPSVIDAEKVAKIQEKLDRLNSISAMDNQGVVNHFSGWSDTDLENVLSDQNAWLMLRVFGITMDDEMKVAFRKAHKFVKDPNTRALYTESLTQIQSELKGYNLSAAEIYKNPEKLNATPLTTQDVWKSIPKAVKRVEAKLASEDTSEVIKKVFTITTVQTVQCTPTGNTTNTVSTTNEVQTIAK